jgi:hypothetical protein
MFTGAELAPLTASSEKLCEFDLILVDDAAFRALRRRFFAQRRELHTILDTTDNKKNKKNIINNNNDNNNSSKPIDDNGSSAALLYVSSLQREFEQSISAGKSGADFFKNDILIVKSIKGDFAVFTFIHHDLILFFFR